ncbi:hypothetical protein C8P68_10391 [Mucilaginibacter yixingensis]|uniref:PH domain-containing protein n=1 Tax=Mucilaginibacter yixingensis TaxID=1295612 RepID=A0A2T5JAN0_9SPHI|nr:hypothetical protein [Mucilaginibacter yixingensis]PTQ97932.1 hypothetical protein C8P68_10391 [Mucilaginibacter yixingensis]
MANNLTSKIQYKNYEKGEFSDEQDRSLEETLELIKSFPWDAQRGVDVQASGPGIVINGPADDYLKVSVYFNEKYTVYYLDRSGHLYEFHTSDLDIADQKVADFFHDQLSLSDFEKHFFNAGYRSHFVNKTFWYKVNKFREISRMLSLIPFLLIWVSMLMVFSINWPVWSLLFFSLLTFLLLPLFLYSAFSIFKVYRWSKNMSLWLVQGSDVIIFDNGVGSQSYLKSDICKVNMYGPPVVSRGTVLTTIMEVIFTDSNTIKFPGMVLDPVLFITKIGKQVNINYLEQKTMFRKSIRQL